MSAFICQSDSPRDRDGTLTDSLPSSKLLRISDARGTARKRQRGSEGSSLTGLTDQRRDPCGRAVKRIATAIEPGAITFDTAWCWKKGDYCADWGDRNCIIKHRLTCAILDPE